jgi:hypothetical protein
MPEPACLFPGRNRQPLDAVLRDAGNRRGWDEILLIHRLDTPPDGHAGSLAAQVALEARPFKKLVERPNFPLWVIFWSRGRRHLIPILERFSYS